jgi:hypothetical protein
MSDKLEWNRKEEILRTSKRVYGWIWKCETVGFTECMGW